MQANGGGINNLARQSVAALLNASNPTLLGVGPYPFTQAQIISYVKTVIQTGSVTITAPAKYAGTYTIDSLGSLFDSLNSTDNCPLGNAPGSAGPT